MDFSLVIPAFIAGILTFLAPCTLPLVPGYLAFISGASVEDLKDPERAKGAKRRIFLNGVLYVLGFSLVFIAFGMLAGFLGTALAPYRIWLTRVGGILVITFGLFLIGVLKLPFLTKDFQLKVGGAIGRGQGKSSFILGSAFAFGWTPCVGPILGSILLLASTTTTAIQGAFLLSVFSLGLAIPFLAVALGVGSASKYIAKLSKLLSVISVIGGIFLIGLGILLFTNKMTLLIYYGYQFFDFINYDALIDYL
ncbi:MAG: sulfite exporter TauE/SafE family protein [Candidatus Liptonbacteria bacterium]|nr:sulfite exporter TauE/SafE family protein [Candidatus Liptonbacteria bacterium]